MSRTTSHVGTAGGLPGTATSQIVDPGWQQWIDLVDIALGETGDAAWMSILPSPVARPANAPLLEGATLRVDQERASDLARRLAAAVGIVAEDGIDALEMIRSAITRDHDGFERMSNHLAVPADTLAVVAQLAATPLLHACARGLGADSPRTWQRGYCPVCGAWPVLVEMRGIERVRCLRCGCCGADWPLPLLHCAFCDEIDHHHLGSLLLEGEEQQTRIETCESCHGYLKAVTTLGALPFRTLALKDLETIPLDLAAQDRGYARPAHPGWPLRIELVT